LALLFATLLLSLGGNSKAKPQRKKERPFDLTAYLSGDRFSIVGKDKMEQSAVIAVYDWNDNFLKAFTSKTEAMRFAVTLPEVKIRTIRSLTPEQVKTLINK
jgi:hypothetical protein